MISAILLVAGQSKRMIGENKLINDQGIFWRPRPESNWDKRICNPLRNHSATWPPRQM